MSRTWKQGVRIRPIRNTFITPFAEPLKRIAAVLEPYDEREFIRRSSDGHFLPVMDDATTKAIGGNSLSFELLRQFDDDLLIVIGRGAQADGINPLTAVGFARAQDFELVEPG